MELEWNGLTIDTDYTPPTDDHLREGPGPQAGTLTGTAIYIPDGYTLEDCEEAWDIWKAHLIGLGLSPLAAETDAEARHKLAVVVNGNRITGTPADFFLSRAASMIEDATEDADRDYCPEEEGLNL